MRVGRTLISAQEIDEALARVGAQIDNDYAGKELLMIGVLKGAFIVMADLARHVTVPVEFDFMMNSKLKIWIRKLPAAMF